MPSPGHICLAEVSSSSELLRCSVSVLHGLGPYRRPPHLPAAISSLQWMPATHTAPDAAADAATDASALGLLSTSADATVKLVHVNTGTLVVIVSISICMSFACHLHVYVCVAGQLSSRVLHSFLMHRDSVTGAVLSRRCLWTFGRRELFQVLFFFNQSPASLAALLPQVEVE